MDSDFIMDLEKLSKAELIEMIEDDVKGNMSRMYHSYGADYVKERLPQLRKAIQSRFGIIRANNFFMDQLMQIIEDTLT